jgi:hypothetical protein
MKLRMPKRALHTPTPAITAVAYCCERIDRAIPLLRTLFLMAGVLAAALKAGALADYLFGAGLLLHWTIWFQRWWTTANWRP